MKRPWLWVLSAIIAALLLTAVVVAFSDRNAVSSHDSAGPAVVPVQTETVKPVPSPAAPEPEPALPAEVNLDVPFTPQAPFANWDAVHEETCEEASILMAEWFVRKKAGLKQAPYTNLIPADEAERELQDLVAWQRQTFGYFEDTTAEETVRIMKEKQKIANVSLVENPTTEIIKKELAKGSLVIVPAAGHLLKNPYFTPPGPPYHMVVIRGYNAQGFIVNDPGTRRGESFIYSESNLLDSIHDWTGSDATVTSGQKVVIVVGA